MANVINQVNGQPVSQSLVISFLRSELETSTQALQAFIAPVAEFFDREGPALSIAGYELEKIKVHRSGGRGTGARDSGDGLLYEAPFAEATYVVRFHRKKAKDGSQKNMLPYLYNKWCESPPALDAWLSRGADQYIFDGFANPIWKEKITLEELSFGIVIRLTNFCPEDVIDCTKTVDDKRVINVYASFDHVHKYLKIFLTLCHTCEDYRGAVSNFVLEIEYSSIARAIVDMKEEHTNLYLRLTHPAILHGSTEDDQKHENLPQFHKYNRCNTLGCTSPGCALKISSRRLGGTNTVKLRWKSAVGVLRTLHNIFAKLQHSDSFVASMRIMKKPKPGIQEVNTQLVQFFKDDSIAFRAKYAVEACKLISFDLTRQLAVLPTEDIKEFIEKLKNLASHEGTHKLFEKTMFHLLKAVDEGNVVVYRDAVPCQFRKFEVQERERRRMAIDDSEKPVQGMAIIYKVFLTPSRTILRPPEEHGENRILRQVGSDYMLRLAFRDDDLRSLTHSLNGKLGHSFLDCFLKEFLRRGVSLVGRKYEYLAASSSQLRDHGCWFHAEDEQGRTAGSIRQEMGSFDNIKNVGKKMAREGLCFSSTIETVTVPEDECITEPDVTGGKHPWSGKPYTFSDGIGKISAELRDDVCEALSDTLKGRKPSAFQIRYQGAKGMVAYDPSLKGRRLVLRDSMVKFDCPATSSSSFEVIKYSEERSMTLNKQIITILEQLQVPASVFLQYQEANIIDFTDALVFENVACARLTASVKKDSDCLIDYSKFRQFGMSVIRDPYFRSMLIELFRNVITSLRSKARIAIPWNLGRNLLGVMDETGKLEYGQIYIRYTVREDFSGPDTDEDVSAEGDCAAAEAENAEIDGSFAEPPTKVVTGKVVVTKCPCVHPGDVRMLEAVDVPELSHLIDVIVFPRKGPRPHPNEMAGSDLDGDEYSVLWDPQFFFKCQCKKCKLKPRPDGNHEPMIFDDTPADKKDNITLEDYYDFICQFIMTDNKGQISNAHLAHADAEPEGIFSKKCLELAKKVSVCLDFAKTGRGTELENDERVKTYPDFMEKQNHKPSYCSENVLGQLYRACRSLENTVSMSSIDCNEKYINQSFELEGWEQMEGKAIEFVKKYEMRLTKIMEHMGIKSEAEIMVSIVNQVGKYQSKGFHEIEELQEQLERQRALLNKRMKEDFNKLTGNDVNLQLLFASACYMIVYDPPGGQPRTHFYGAPWILFDLLLQCSMLNKDVWDPTPCCSLAMEITKAIEKKLDPKLKDIEKTMVILRDWAEEEGLMGEKKDIAICCRCLYSVYQKSQESFEEVEIEPSVGTNVMLFIRYCATKFESKAQNFQFFTCKEDCAMHRKDKSIFHRMTMAAMRTYSALAVTGDICEIKGFSCGKAHTSRTPWSARHCFPLVLNVQRKDSRTFLGDNKAAVADVLKKWCDAEEDDRIFLHFENSKGYPQVEVIIDAKEWVRHALEDRLYREEERILIQKLQDEVKKLGQYQQSNLRVHQDLR